MENKENPPERTCAACGSVFIPQTAKQRYCKASCRRDQYEKRQKQLAREEAQKARHQREKLDQLEADAQAPTLPAQAINPDWQVLDQSIQTLELKCWENEKEGEQINQQIREPDQWGWGAGLGILLFLIGIGLYCDHRRRHRQELGIAFWIIFLGGIAPVGKLGSLLGEWMADALKTEPQQPDLTETREGLLANRDALTDGRQVIADKLDELIRARDQVAKYGPPGVNPLDKEPAPPIYPA